MASEYLKNSTAIDLWYINEDWDTLERMANKKGYPNFRAYLNAMLHVAAKKIEVIEEDAEDNCIPCKKRNNKYFLPADITPQLVQLAKDHCIPLNTAIKLFFVDPLIKEDASITP